MKLIIPPDSSAYSATPGNSVVSTELAGGAARYRRDLLNPTSTVDVTWITEKAGYTYLRAFHRGVTVGGSLPFDIDLILDDADLTTHSAHFKPGTFKLVAQQGLSYTVTASLEVEPLSFSISDLTDIVSVYNEFGGDWQQDEATFNDLVNVEIPHDDL